MTAPPPFVLPAGARINGRYEIRSRLGAGMNGVVYEVWDHIQEQVGALKLLTNWNPASAWDESRVLTNLSGEFVLPIRNADHAGGVPFIVTEIARNGSVADVLTASTGIGIAASQAVTWIQQACRGVSRVHDLGLLHNDIKPDNLFISDTGGALVADLGLACLRDVAGRGHFAGTPATMAPEVALIGSTVAPINWQHHRPTSIASDVYSLGASLYWLLSGSAPYSGPDAIQVMTEIAASAPRPIRDVAPHVPQGLGDIVSKAMHRDPFSRFDTASALDAALGARALHRRVWTRLASHAGHTACFSGTGRGADLSVCAVPTGIRSEHQIQARHKTSGRRVSPWVTAATISSVPRVLRSTFRRLD